MVPSGSHRTTEEPVWQVHWLQVCCRCCCGSRMRVFYSLEVMGTDITTFQFLFLEDSVEPALFAILTDLLLRSFISAVQISP